MTIEMLKQSYKEQLVKAGVEPQRAMEVAASITTEELALIGEIWADWAEVVRDAGTEVSAVVSELLEVN